MRELLITAVLVLTACDRSSPKPPRSAEPAAFAPAVSVTVHDAGDGSAGDAVRQRLVGEVLEYTYDAVPVIAGWDGSCAAQIQRMKKLEPLVRKIRVDTMALGPDGTSQIKVALLPHKAETMAKLDRQLADLHLTRAQLESKERAMKAACGADPGFKAEMDRIGVFKKKTP